VRVKVLAFATARDAIGAREVTVEIADGAGLSDLRLRLESDYPELEQIWDRLAIAIDGVLAGADSGLTEGSEVALLPPVSGGSGPSRAAEPPIELVREKIDNRQIVERTSHPSCGACLVFEGRVRDSRGDRVVTKLSYDGYEPMAVNSLKKIRRELEETYPDLRLAVIHRLGEVPVGEASVSIVAAAPHRAAAFEACRETLERLKREVPIWKQEHYADGTAEWREEEALK